MLKDNAMSQNLLKTNLTILIHINCINQKMQTIKKPINTIKGCFYPYHVWTCFWEKKRSPFAPDYFLAAIGSPKPRFQDQSWGYHHVIFLLNTKKKYCQSTETETCFGPNEQTLCLRSLYYMTSYPSLTHVGSNPV